MALPIEERSCLCDSQDCWICVEEFKLTMEDIQRARDNWEQIEREAIQRLLDAIAEEDKKNER